MTITFLNVTIISWAFLAQRCGITLDPHPRRSPPPSSRTCSRPGVQPPLGPRPEVLAADHPASPFVSADEALGRTLTSIAWSVRPPFGAAIDVAARARRWGPTHLVAASSASRWLSSPPLRSRSAIELRPACRSNHIRAPGPPSLRGHLQEPRHCHQLHL